MPRYLKSSSGIIPIWRVVFFIDARVKLPDVLNDFVMIIVSKNVYFTNNLRIRAIFQVL